MQPTTPQSTCATGSLKAPQQVSTSALFSWTDSFLESTRRTRRIQTTFSFEYDEFVNYAGFEDNEDAAEQLQKFFKKGS